MRAYHGMAVAQQLSQLHLTRERGTERWPNQAFSALRRVVLVVGRTQTVVSENTLTECWAVLAERVRLCKEFANNPPYTR